MQCLSIEAAYSVDQLFGRLLGQSPACSVAPISHQRVTDRGQVYTHLMRSTSLLKRLDRRMTAECLDGLHARDSISSILSYALTGPVAKIPAYRHIKTSTL